MAELDEALATFATKARASSSSATGAPPGATVQGRVVSSHELSSVRKRHEREFGAARGDVLPARYAINPKSRR